MRLENFLNELFKTDIKTDEITVNPIMYVVSFVVGDILYKFSATEFGGEWHVAFTAEEDIKKGYKFYGGREDILGTGNAVQVFSTIIKILKKFVKKYRPHSFHFYGKEKSRQKLYDRFAKMIEKEGFKYTKFKDPEWAHFGMRYNFVKERKKKRKKR